MKAMKAAVGLMLALGLLTGVARAAAETPLDAGTIVQRIEERNPSLQSFQARVHVDVRMLNFPWLSPKLEGTSYFKRPNNYEVVFDRVPSYAHGISKLFADIADPSLWQKECNIQFDGVQDVEGHPLLTLRMTKKAYSDQLKDSVAYVDPVTYQVTRMDWNYRNGGSITMHQTFRGEGPYSVIATQHADIHIPHVRAVADATYETYQTNVAVDDSVFTKNK